MTIFNRSYLWRSAELQDGNLIQFEQIADLNSKHYVKTYTEVRTKDLYTDLSQ